jgi:hypothetical protein
MLVTGSRAIEVVAAKEKGPGSPGPFVSSIWRALEDLNLRPSDS